MGRGNASKNLAKIKLGVQRKNRKNAKITGALSLTTPKGEGKKKKKGTMSIKNF